MFWVKFLELCNSIDKAPNVVAAEIGIKSSGTVTGWKNGAVPRQNILMRIADYFGVSIEYLLSGEPDNKKSPAPESAELDPVTQELYDIVNTSDMDELKALLEMARLIKKRRN